MVLLSSAPHPFRYLAGHVLCYVDLVIHSLEGVTQPAWPAVSNAPHDLLKGGGDSVTLLMEKPYLVL